MFPSGCPFLQHLLEPLEVMNKAASCVESGCPYHDGECTFFERFLTLILGRAPETNPLDDS